MECFKRKINLFFIAQILLTALCGGSFAQDDVYHIGPRDVLEVTIYAGGEEQQKVEVTVNEQGKINLPLVGQIKASGLSVSELRTQIHEPLSNDFFVNPEVTINIKEYHSLRYYISGAVKEPGLYETSSRQSMMKLIAKAGGVVPERGSVAYILRDATDRIQSGEAPETLLANKSQTVDLKKLLDEGDLTQDVLLNSGDVVYIPLKEDRDVAESSIYVEGEIKNPGVYPYQSGLTALNACLMAGGFSKFAAPNRARIIRKTGKGQIIIGIDLNRVKQGVDPDVELKPGDLINIPETWL
jgi:polysaccharide export outer membrane protein